VRWRTKITRSAKRRFKAGEISEKRPAAFPQAFSGRFRQIIALRGPADHPRFSIRVFIACCIEAQGAFSRFNSDISGSRIAESVRRDTLTEKLMDCACKWGLIDFVLAHGEPVLCRYAPNPR
jgi:hypothetical protein